MSSTSADRAAATESTGEVADTGLDMPPTRGWPASWFLLAVVGMALLPSFVFSTVLLREIGEAHEAQREEALLFRAKTILHTVDLQVQDSITALRILGTSEALEQSDYRALQKRLETALADSVAHILVLDDELQQIINTRVPFGTPLGKTADPESSSIAVGRRAPYVSTVFYGKVAQTEVFNVVLPVFKQDRLRHVLIMTRNTDWLMSLLGSVDMPAEEAILVDQAEQIVATSPGAAKHSLALIEALVTETAEGDAKVGATTHDGTRYRYAHDHSNLSGWRVIKYVPEAALGKTFGQPVSKLIGFTLLVLLACVLVAMWVARQVTQPLTALAGAVQQPADHAFPRDTRIREINLAAAALGQAATEREERTAHVEFLLREMAHRVNNQFSVIEAIFRQTKKNTDSEEKFHQAFVERLHGLSRSISALSHEGWAAAAIRNLVDEHVGRFADAASTETRLSGPDLRISPRAAESLGLALHELATNSLKYGALSLDAGSIVVAWQRSDDGSRFTMSWREDVGQPVPPPDRRGFGSFVLREIVAQQLAGRTELRHGADGIVWRIECPWETVAEIVRKED